MSLLALLASLAAPLPVGSDLGSPVVFTPLELELEGAVWVDVGDVDGDGRKDLVTVTAEPNALVVLQNVGGLDFAIGQTIDLGSTPSAVALGDLDGDLDLDAVVTLVTTSRLLVLEGAGDGTFALETSLPVAAAPMSPVLADLNGDSDLDVVLAHFTAGGRIGVLLGGAGLSLAPTVVPTYDGGPYTRYVEPVDLNGDGILDLVTSTGQFTNEFFNSVRYLGRGDGGFDAAPLMSWSATPFWMASGDVDGDGDLDLAAPTYDLGETTGEIRVNDGTGGFAYKDLFFGGNGGVLELVDLNQNGTLDAVHSSFASLSGPGWALSVHRNDGTGAFEYVGAQFGSPAKIVHLTTTDLDGDGWIDVAAALDPPGKLTVWRNDSVCAVGPNLLGCPPRLSLEDGGAQDFELVAPGLAGELYLLLGSVTGTSPGLPTGVGTLPLNFDAYFQLTLLHPNVTPLVDTLGFLDANGEAQAQLAFPAGLDPSLAGLTLNHAFLVLDLASFDALFASNATPLLLEP